MLGLHMLEKASTKSTQRLDTVSFTGFDSQVATSTLQVHKEV